MYLHLAPILPVCKTFNPFLKQTIAQPKDWMLHFPVLASALGNLGNYDLSSVCSEAERLQPAPAPAEGMSPDDLGAMSCQQSCHTWALCWSLLGELFTEGLIEVQKMSLHQIKVCRNFPMSSHIVLRRLWGELVDSSPHQNAAKVKALYLVGGWYQSEWEIGWTKLNLKIIYPRIKRRIKRIAHMLLRSLTLISPCELQTKDSLVTCRHFSDEPEKWTLLYQVDLHCSCYIFSYSSWLAWLWAVQWKHIISGRPSLTLPQWKNPNQCPGNSF